jgi:4-hydroxybenzoyl-CoA reductase subunit beta
MEFMPDFTVLYPKTVEKAVSFFTQHPDARYVAGGTDLIVNIRRGIVAPRTLIDLAGIGEMNTIEDDTKGGYKIGASVTLAALLKHKAIVKNYAAIEQAAVEIAAATHRQVATVGGNLCLDTRCIFYNQSEWWRSANDYCLKYRGETCHVAPSGDHCFAAFSGDLAPALLVFDADVEITGPAGTRTVPLKDIYADDGAAHLLLEPGEILVAVVLADAGAMHSGYAKARVRDSIDFPLAGSAIALKKGKNGIEDIRIALTGVKSCPVLIEGAEGLIGRIIDDKTLDVLASLLPKQIKPMTSTFTPPGYRRKVATNLSRRLASRLYDLA